jgi:integrase
VRKTFKTKTAAKQWRNDAYAALRAGTTSANRSDTLAAYAEQWMVDGRAGVVRNRSGDPFKPSAIRTYDAHLRLHVLPALGHLRIREVTTRDVQNFIDRLVREGCASGTVDSALTPLRSMYRRAVIRGDAATNPAHGVEKPAVRPATRRIVPPSEADAMLSALSTGDRPLWATAFYAGLRHGELAALRWEDVDLASGVLHVRRGWDEVEGEITPKSRKGIRDVPIPLVLRDDLVEHRMSIEGEGAVFPRRIRSYTRAAAKRWREAGLARLTLHETRHTYASLMIASGVNVKALSTYMGHANIGITLDLYGHLFPGNEAEAANLLDTFLARTGAQAGAHPEDSPC